MTEFWTEKYRPKVIEDYLFENESDKQTILDYLKQGFIPHIILSGIRGTGKTSLAKIICRHLNVDKDDILKIDGSKNNSVDTVRLEITPFSSVSSNGAFKVVIIEEASRLTVQAQEALKVILEEHSSNTRFIFTTNDLNKMDEAVKSRCQKFTFGAGNVNQITELAATILVRENVEFDLDVLDKIVAKHYPDIRAVINEIQQRSTTGILLLPSSDANNSIQLVKSIEAAQWKQAFEYAYKIPATDWEEIYVNLYNNLHTYSPFKDMDKWKQGIMVISEHLYKHNTHAHKQMNGAACVVHLSNIK